jgi:hypothetical protein
VLEAAELGAAAAAELLRVVPAEAVGDVLVEQAVAEVVGVGGELVVEEEVLERWEEEVEDVPAVLVLVEGAGRGREGILLVAALEDLEPAGMLLVVVVAGWPERWWLVALRSLPAAGSGWPCSRAG